MSLGLFEGPKDVATFGLGFSDFMTITDSILVVNDQKIDQFIEQITRHSTRSKLLVPILAS